MPLAHVERDLDEDCAQGSERDKLGERRREQDDAQQRSRRVE